MHDNGESIARVRDHDNAYDGHGGCPHESANMRRRRSAYLHCQSMRGTDEGDIGALADAAAQAGDKSRIGRDGPLSIDTR